MFPAACDSVHEELKQPWSINSMQGDKNWARLIFLSYFNHRFSADPFRFEVNISCTLPNITALMMSPTMFCRMRTVMAVGHCSVITRSPKPMVTWTSMENRKADVNDLQRGRQVKSDILGDKLLWNIPLVLLDLSLHGWNELHCERNNVKPEKR